MRDEELEQMDERMQTDGMIDRATEKTNQPETDLPHLGEEGERSQRMDTGTPEREENNLEGDAGLETAEELADPVPTREMPRDEVRNEGSGLGTPALILSVLSLLLLPFILAPAGIILGIIGGIRGSRLGWWAVGVGVFSIIVNLAAAPYMRVY